MTEPTNAEILALALELGIRMRTGGGAIKLVTAALEKWGQPAQAEEPVATQWLAEMIMSDCGCSTENQRLLDRIIDRIQQYDRASAAPQPSTAAQGDALSDAVRVPLDSLHADAAYLIGRLLDGSMPYVRVIEIIRERIDAAKAAIRVRAARAPADSVTAPAPAVQHGGATRAAARALSDRVAEMCNVDKEDHWQDHHDEVLSDTVLVISTYLAAHAQATPAAVAGPSEAVAYLDIGTGGYLDLGTDLTDEALSRLPKGRRALVIAGTYGIDGYAAAPTAQPAPQQEPSQTAGMTLAQRILHVGGRNNAAGYVEFGSTQAVEALVRQVLRDLPRPSPTPQADSVLEDAARYRHLRDCNSGSLVVMQITGTGEDDWHVLTEHDADAAIDAARKQGGE